MEYLEYLSRGLFKIFLTTFAGDSIVGNKEGIDVKLELYIGTNCYGGDCPTIYRSDRGSFVVQGALINAGDIKDLVIPANEGVVEIPESLVQALAAKVANR